ncbi:Rv3235 family protein [Nocardia sp. NPDC051463]|uniref:Rv3235 family protein n=1 Tax=Nocardia sp. NPDC051463 TaxID=3154845 RepID=UPI0034502D21
MDELPPSPRERMCRARPAGDSAGVGRIAGPSAAETAIFEVNSATKLFADRTLRLTLEVLDHRRPVAQLAAVAEPPVLSAVRTLVRADLVPGRTLGAAVLTRVDVIMVDAAAAEVCAAYDRGGRHFALAARITRTRAKGWRLSALRLF